MASNITYPSITTWYICSEGEEYAIGKVEPNQVMDSGLTDMDTYTTEQDWLDALDALGITPEE